MAHIFKHPTCSAKGILVFTHKEMGFFEGRVRRPPMRRAPWRFFNYVVTFLLAKLRRAFFRRHLETLRSSYFIGIHWGMFAENVETPDWVDFHMAAKGTASFKGEPFVIPLNSANFTPKIMAPQAVEKYWDIICVAKNDNKKKYDELLCSVRKIYDAGFEYKILFVVASNLYEPASRYYSSLLSDYNSNFSAAERELFTIIKTHPETGFQGFSYTFLSRLYNSSKVFTLFSQKEGASKAIKEAQLCGLPVVVKSDLAGGGRDFLNESNSCFFDSYESAHEALIKAVKNYESLRPDSEELARMLREDFTLDELKRYFAALYASQGRCFDGELLNTDALNRRLPAHLFDSSVYWARCERFRFTTTDIHSKSLFRGFLAGLQSSQ